MTEQEFLYGQGLGGYENFKEVLDDMEYLSELGYNEEILKETYGYQVKK